MVGTENDDHVKSCMEYLMPYNMSQHKHGEKFVSIFHRGLVLFVLSRIEAYFGLFWPILAYFGLFSGGFATLNQPTN